MKKLILSLVAIATLSLSSFGQAPEGFKYQAVVRDAGNTILNNQAVGMRMTIQQGSIGGTTVYSETFAPTTNAYGLVNLEIGNGTVVTGTFANIDWANGPYFIETAVDVTGGTTYTVMGTSQLMSVPYALYAKTSGNGQGPVGPQGPAGADGTNGTDGAIGLTGPAGANGTNGTNGTDGATGLTGPAGADGTNGTNGNDGAVGATGPQGIQGPAGNDGVDGATGPQGLTGAAGADGTNGTDGATGLTGLTGPAGIDGTNGTNGNDGAVGAMGPQGIQGPAGNDGAVGAIGPQGIQGPAGTNGTVGATGPAGPTGATGGYPVHYIGESYGGGIVFYVYDGGQHGLIAATADQSGGLQWYNGTNRVTGTSGDGIGSGTMNTVMIVATQMADNQTGNFAAKVCADYSVAVGGVNYGDWYLPSKDELTLLYQNVGPSNGNIIGLSGAYWSSTEVHQTSTWLQSSANNWFPWSKDFPWSVRAIRAF